jgi:hypothetical protein
VNKFPLRYAHGNILVGRGAERGAIYRVNPISYPYLRDKGSWASRLQLFTHDVKADYSLYRVNREYEVEAYVQQALRNLDNRYKTEKLLRQFVEQHKDKINGRKAYFPEFYLIPRIVTEATDGFGVALGRDMERVRATAEDALGVGKLRPISKAEINGLIEAEEEMHATVTDRLPARRATTRELQWLFRRAAYRGHGEPPLDDYWEPNALVVETDDGHDAYVPLGTDMLSLGNEPIRNAEGFLQARTEEGVLWQAILYLGALPDETIFPGESEFLFTPLERASFPVDMVMHVEWEANSQAISRVQRKVRDADNVLSDEDESAAGAKSWASEDDARQARRLDMRLRRSDQPPLLRTSVSFAIGGCKTTNEVKAKISELRALFGTVKLWLPVGTQKRAFYDHLPRVDGGRVTHYRDWLTPLQFATLMPIATHDLGSRSGTYIGYVDRRSPKHGHERPLFNDLRRAPEENRASAYLLAGTQGSGKTTAAELMAVGDALSGGQIVDVDPKPDHHLEEVDELKGRVEVVDLDDPVMYAGLLDPFLVLPRSQVVDGAYSYFMELLPTNVPSTWGTQVRKAAQVVAEMEKPCAQAVIDLLMRTSAGEDANAAGDALGTRAAAGLARLAFSNGERQFIDRAQVTVIRPSALVLPDSMVSRADYDEIERLSVATLRLIAYFAMRLINNDRTIHKTLLLDEAHFLLATPSGRRLIWDIVRQGRAKFATSLIASQHIADPGEIVKLIGTFYIFGMETLEEARDALALLNLDPDNDELAQMIVEAREGKCFVKDIWGHVVRAQIDVSSPRLLRQLNTNPAERARQMAT